MTFEDLHLSDELLEAVNTLGFEEPTPVQAEAIPFMLEEARDLVTLSQTGTGKTAAFGLPILQLISNKNDEIRNKPSFETVTRCLVLSPTRELCMQIAKDLRSYAQNLPELRIVAVYGGEDIRVQLRALDRTPQIIVATPGRLIDLQRRGKVDLSTIQYLVLDEADEMLSMGFQEDIETILKETPQERRTMLFSATMPREIADIAKNYLHDPEEITIGVKNSGTEHVDHIYYVCRAAERYEVLKRILDLNPDIYALVFCRTRQETKDIAEKLMKDGYNADALHGDLTQTARDYVMQKFRQKLLQVLVATDVAARGLDVHDLTHVINYQLPDDSEVYTHRSGRTGRADKHGISVSIIHSREKRRIQQLEQMLKRQFQRQPIPDGMEVCKKQLFHLIGRMQQVEVNEEQIGQWMPEIYSILGYLDKEEVIKRFVSLEFNRFLDYYKDAKDLNVVEKEKYGKEKGKMPSGRGERSERGDGKARRGKKVRLKINIGADKGANAKRILGAINDATRDRTILISDIEIAPHFSFFSVFEDQKDRVIRAFNRNPDVYVGEAKGRIANKNDEIRNKPSGRGERTSWTSKTSRTSKTSKSEKPWRQRRKE